MSAALAVLALAFVATFSSFSFPRVWAISSGVPIGAARVAMSVVEPVFASAFGPFAAAFALQRVESSLRLPGLMFYYTRSPMAPYFVIVSAVSPLASGPTMLVVSAVSLVRARP